MRKLFKVLLGLFYFYCSVWTPWISPTFPRSSKESTLWLAPIIYTWYIWWNPLSPRLCLILNKQWEKHNKLFCFFLSLFLLGSWTQKFGFFFILKLVFNRCFNVFCVNISSINIVDNTFTLSKGFHSIIHFIPNNNVVSLATALFID